MTPVIIVNGPANSGKDTVAQMIVDRVGGQCIAQADPMKRFVMQAFGFSEHQLWGPSEERNRPDPRFVHGSPAWFEARNFVCASPYGEQWLSELGLKQAINLLTNWFETVEEKYNQEGQLLTPRYVLQTLGTEFGRNVNPEIWSRVATQTASALLRGRFSYTRTTGLVNNDSPGVELVVITDGRFRNEIINVSAIGGKTLKIQPVQETDTIGSAGVAGHKSEAEQKTIPDFWYDCIYTNDKSKGLENLRVDVSEVILKKLQIL